MHQPLHLHDFDSFLDVQLNKKTFNSFKLLNKIGTNDLSLFDVTNVGGVCDLLQILCSTVILNFEVKATNNSIYQGYKIQLQSIGDAEFVQWQQK